MHANTLFAAPFDVTQRKLTGPSAAVLEGVLNDSFSGAGFFAVSSAGSLVYAPGASHLSARRLVWVDRSGRRSPITSARRPFASPRVSPDGRRVALFLEETAVNIWVYELARDILTRVSFGLDDHNVAWSPDGTRIAFESTRDGVHQVQVRSADGSGEAEQITHGEYDHFLCDWSPDGRSLVYVEFHPETGADLWVVESEGSRQPRAFLNTPFYEKQATFSPNGRWLAYVSDETGRYEVYVQSFPGPGPKNLVSSGGGEEPAWSPSGRELFYRSGGRMTSVALSETPELTATRPEVLFEGLFHYAAFPTRSYDVGPDGRFIMVAEPELTTRELEVVLNWSEELKRADR
jgi:Tol biopolymer transport system component